MTLPSVFRLLKDTGIAWNDDDISTHGAALAYYAIFSVAPLLLIAIAMAGVFFGHEASQGRIFVELQGLLGATGARSIERLVLNAAQTPREGILATVLGVAALIFAASGVFRQLQQSLNRIWRVTAAPGRSFWVFLRRRILAFSMVVVIGTVLMASLLLATALAALTRSVGIRLPGGAGAWQIGHALVSFGITTVVFAAVYKLLPDVKLAWRDVWLGAAMTSLLFTLGKFLIGLYLAHGGIASSYGAAGSLVVVLLWVFYASQIIYFGAEFTRVQARARGARIAVKPGSILLEQPAPAPVPAPVRREPKAAA